MPENESCGYYFSDTVPRGKRLSFVADAWVMRFRTPEELIDSLVFLGISESRLCLCFCLNERTPALSIDGVACNLFHRKKDNYYYFTGALIGRLFGDSKKIRKPISIW